MLKLNSGTRPLAFVNDKQWSKTRRYYCLEKLSRFDYQTIKKWRLLRSLLKPNINHLYYILNSYGYDILFSHFGCNKLRHYHTCMFNDYVINLSLHLHSTVKCFITSSSNFWAITNMVLLLNIFFYSVDKVWRSWCYETQPHIFTFQWLAHPTQLGETSYLIKHFLHRHRIALKNSCISLLENGIFFFCHCMNAQWIVNALTRIK